MAVCPVHSGRTVSLPSTAPPTRLQSSFLRPCGATPLRRRRSSEDSATCSGSQTDSQSLPQLPWDPRTFSRQRKCKGAGTVMVAEFSPPRLAKGWKSREVEPVSRTGTALVGLFDSGVGGLSVVSAMKRLHPEVSMRYVGDTAFFPYGDKTPEFVAARSLQIGKHLVGKGCKLIVVACNSATSASLELLRASLPVPVVGMEPPVKASVALSKSRNVVLLATKVTVNGRRLAALTSAVAKNAQITVLPMPGLADLVEAGELSGPRVRQMLGNALYRHVANGADTVALGCSHYGFLSETLRDMLPDHVRIVDPAEGVAQRVIHLLEKGGHIGPAPSISSRGGSSRQQGGGDMLAAAVAAVGAERPYDSFLPPALLALLRGSALSADAMVARPAPEGRVFVSATGDFHEFGSTIKRLQDAGAPLPILHQVHY